MAEFLIRMADERGQVLEQVEHSHSEAELRDRYAQQGFLVYSVKPRGLFAGGELQLGGNRVKQDEFIIFNAQFLTLIKAGLPILTALDLLHRRQRNRYFRRVLEDVRDRLRSGESLSQAFEAQTIFPKIYTTTLLAGEKSGNLDEVLGRYIAFQRVANSVRRKLLASLVYPALLLVLVTVMLTFLVTFVVPRFAELYRQLEVRLPVSTEIMLTIGVFIQKWFPLIIGVLLLVVFLIWRWQRSERGAQALDSFRMKLPLVGAIWLKYQVAMFSRMLSTLLAGGLPLVPALQTAGASMQSRLLASGISRSAQRVREGAPLSRSLEETKVMPDLAVEMIEVGESTGSLPGMLNSVAEFYEEDVATSVAAALTLIEPVILIFMGVVVVGVLISLYMPIFSLGSGGLHR
ncbi:MAG TPA: type II secretion system F family protein [Terriglobales bacterium]|nr:type II secretion system F family protein [Terriglobales bacterium]